MSTPRLAVATIETQFDTDNTLPYLSPTSLFADEEEGVKERAASNWGGYDNGSSTRQESLQRWQEKESEGNSNQKFIAPVAPTSRESIVELSPTSATANQVPTTSGTYVIPKLSNRGILSNKVNELAVKVSPPAQAILPKPSGTVQNSRSLFYTSGLRPQKKTK